MTIEILFRYLTFCQHLYDGGYGSIRVCITEERNEKIRNWPARQN